MPDQADLRTRTARDRLADLERQLAEMTRRIDELEKSQRIIDIMMSCAEDKGYHRGRESVLGKGAQLKPLPRPRHLRIAK